jgi:dienelactone hydrolase
MTTITLAFALAACGGGDPSYGESGLAITAADPETRTLVRTDGSILTYYLARPSSTPAPIVFNLQGSDCESYHADDHGMASLLSAVVVRLEKRGFPTTEQGCPEEYMQHNTIDDRVHDYLAVVDALRHDPTVWDQRSVSWMGGSEGAYVAALAAPQVPETKAAVLLSMGGGMTFADERQTLLSNHGETCDGITSVDDLRRQFQIMLADPTSDRTFCGDTNTYKWWASMLPVKPVAALQQTTFPLYLGIGTMDTMVPVESADAFAKTLGDLGRGDLTFVKHVGLDHGFQDAHGVSRAHDVIRLALAWLQTVR